MAIAVDSTLVGTGGPSVSSSQVLSNFSTGGSNRLVLVLTDETQDSGTVSSVTATGLTFSKIASVFKGTNQGNTEVWGAVAQSQQTNVAITVTFTATTPSPYSAARTYCFSGVDLTNGVAGAYGATKGTAFASGVNPSDSITTTRNNSQVIAALGADAFPTVTAGSGVTNDGTTSANNQFAEISSLRRTAITTSSGTSVTMSASFSTNQASGLVIVELLEATLLPSRPGAGMHPGKGPMQKRFMSKRSGKGSTVKPDSNFFPFF